MVMKSLLSVNQLSVSFKQGTATTNVVKDVSFTIHSGETLALVGESGSGKSVTAHSIMRLLPYPMAFHPSGSITFDDQDLLALPMKEVQKLRSRRIGMIFQEPMTALNPLHSVEKQIGEVLKIHQGLDHAQARESTLELLRKVHIEEPEQRLSAYPHQLSGGQRQRVMIAMALANEPELLIADEPTTALDVTVQKEILLLLREIQQQHQMGILLITHDLGVVKHFADRVAVMNEGRLVEIEPTNTLFNTPKDNYTKMLLNSRPGGTPVALTTPIDTRDSIMKTHELCVDFVRKKPLFGKPTDVFHAVKQLSIDIPMGTTLGIVGESGSGKSTLALAMLRLLHSHGEIYYQQHPLHSYKEKDIKPLRRDVQVVFQDPFASLSPRMSVKQIISEGLSLHVALTPEAIDKKVIDIMTEVGLEPETRHRYPHEFSGGQRQRIAIARVLILDPKIVFLDEPTSALDRAVQVQVIDLLRKLQQQRQLSYVFISHDVQVIKVISHRIIVMRHGEIVERGDTTEVLNTPQHPYTQSLLAATLQE